MWRKTFFLRLGGAVAPFLLSCHAQLNVPGHFGDGLGGSADGSALVLHQAFSVTAGTFWPTSGSGGPPTTAHLFHANGAALDSNGNLFIVDSLNSVIRRISAATGTISTIAGVGGVSGMAGDGGPAVSAKFSIPNGIAVDTADNLYIVDTGNHAVRKIDATTQIISLVAGSSTGAQGFSGDGGPANSALLKAPSAVAVDAAGNLFIADTQNQAVRGVDAATGIITTIAGNNMGLNGYSGDGGAATSAKLNGPAGIAVAASGNLYIADSGNNVIREVDAATGQINTIAGIAGPGGYSGDGFAATGAHLNNPASLFVDANENLYLADSNNFVIRKIDHTSGTITTVAGNNVLGHTGDGAAATAASMGVPRGLTVNNAGDFYFSEHYDYIRKVSVSTGFIDTIAGTGSTGYTGNGGLATNAELYLPKGVAVDNVNSVYVADSANFVVRKIDGISGIISTVAGTATAGFSGDLGPATVAKMQATNDVVVNSGGDLFIADSSNNRVRKVNASTGNISTYAGNGTAGYLGDGGAATAARIKPPCGLGLDPGGNLYIADCNNFVVRQVSATTGNISTVAGTGSFGYTGDGGLATSATLSNVSGVTVDPGGNIYLADLSNNVVRRVDGVTGIITTVAGNGTAGSMGDGGPAASAELNGPTSVAFDGSGNLFIADSNNASVRRVDRLTGIISTYAGSGVQGFAGVGGWAPKARMGSPHRITFDSEGNLYIADFANQMIYKVTP